MVLYLVFFIYHVSAGSIYYRYISAREIQYHQNQKDLRQVVKFFDFYREVIVLSWFGFFLYGLCMTIVQSQQQKKK